MQVFAAKNIIGGTTTVSNSSFGFGTTRFLLALEYSGASKGSPVRSSDSHYQSAVGANSITLTYKTGDLIFLFDSGQGIITPPVGFTLRNNVGSPIAAYVYDNTALSSGTSPFTITSDTGDDMLFGITLAQESRARSHVYIM
jgi:hypothetical protein